MATRKKKSDTVVLEMPGTIGSAKVLTPKVVKGSHLTVTTYPDGRTELEWDDDALLRDVRAAILKHESNILASVETTPKKTRKKKA